MTTTDHHVTYHSTTFQTEAVCTCGWESGTWPADGSAQYAGSMHLAEWKEAQ